MNVNNSLSNVDIERILKSRNINVNDIISKDLLPEKLKNGWYIINLQNHNEGNGTHWVCLKVGEQNLYFDSFGVIYPSIIEQKLNNVLYNVKQIQNFKSSSCGWFCIALIYNIERRLIRDDIRWFYDYINRFSKITSFNDKILAYYLEKNGFKID
jgi:hypothetical protein